MKSVYIRRMHLAFGRVAALAFALAGCIPECGQRQRLAKVDLVQLKDATQLFYHTMRKWPSSLQEMAPPSCHGSSCTLRELHNDPWGHPYVLIVKTERITVRSMGGDGRAGGEDDLQVVVWQQ